MAYAIGVIVFIIGISISIALHELGHMLPAKAFGVKVPRYMIGFGPTLWSRKRGETEYGIKAIPLGGYVKLMGMVPPANEVKPVRGHGWAARLIEDTRAAAVEEIEPGEEHRSFYRLSWWKRVIVMSGGALTNLFLAILIFTGIGLFYGVDAKTSRVDGVLECVPPVGVAEYECTATDSVTAALLAGFEVDDRIVSVDDISVDGWEDLSEYIRMHPEEEIAFTVLRFGEEIIFTATPTLEDRADLDSEGGVLYDEDGEILTVPVGFLGVQPTWETVRQSPWWGTTYTMENLGTVAEILWHLPEQLWHIGRAATGLEERDPEGIMSPFGAGRIAGEIATYDDPEVGLGDVIVAMFSLVAGINLALFAFNVIPLTPLDGGHVAGGLWQGIKDGWARMRRFPKARPVDLARMMPLTYVVILLLLLMFILLVYADIVVPIRLT